MITLFLLYLSHILLIISFILNDLFLINHVNFELIRLICYSHIYNHVNNINTNNILLVSYFF